MYEAPPQNFKKGRKLKRIRRAEASDDFSSDNDEVGSVDGPCLMVVRLLLSS